VELFWLVPGRLAGGSRPGARRFPPGTNQRQLVDDLARLRVEGIGAILTLTPRPLHSNRSIDEATRPDRHSEQSEESQQCGEREALAVEDGAPARQTHATLVLTTASSPPLETLHIPIRDFTAPTPEQLATAVAWIDQQLEAGRSTFVHCGGGRGRTGTVLAGWLIAHGRSTEEAVAEVRRVCHHAVETRGQWRALQRFGEAMADDSGAGQP